jgi:phage terminase large subunit GpA-like protein
MTINDCVKSFCSALRPPPMLKVSEWAEKEFVLSPEYSSATGRLRLFPYQKEPLDALGQESGVNKHVWKCASQVMKTLGQQVFTAYTIAVDPGPTLFVEPKDGMADAFSKERFDPMVRDIPAIRDRVAEKKSRDASNTIAMKQFTGGFLAIVGAQRPENGAMRSIRNLFMDEVSRYEDSKEEGDFCSIAEKRAVSTYWNHRIIYASSPTLEGACRISEEYELSDKREYFVPCPACGFMQRITWDRIRYGQQPDGRVIQPDDAHFECGECRALSPEAKKWEMLRGGEWRAQAPGRKIRGYHLSQLYSPLRSWGSCAEEFIAAGKNPTKLQVFVNTVLAETWQEQGDAPDWEKLRGRCEDYPVSTVPSGALFLTAGADVQKDRIEVQVIGWGRGREKWLVDYHVLPGDTSRPEVWTTLTSILNLTYPHASGGEVSILRMAIDSGYATTMVYEWARRQGGARVIVVKGETSGRSLLGMPGSVDITVNGRKVKKGIHIWPVNVNIAKAEIYGYLRQDLPAEGEELPAGWFHFCLPPQGDEYFRQLCAEQFIVKKDRHGYARGEWTKIRERNEVLDTAVYARAAAEQIGVSRFTEREWRRFESVASSSSDGEGRSAARIAYNAPESAPPSSAPPAADQARYGQPAAAARPLARPRAARSNFLMS